VISAIFKTAPTKFSTQPYILEGPAEKQKEAIVTLKYLGGMHLRTLKLGKPGSFYPVPL
jgi:hypothetical protein